MNKWILILLPVLLFGQSRKVYIDSLAIHDGSGNHGRANYSVVHASKIATSDSLTAVEAQLRSDIGDTSDVIETTIRTERSDSANTWFGSDRVALTINTVPRQAADTTALKALSTDIKSAYIPNGTYAFGHYQYVASGYTADKIQVFDASGGGYWVEDDYFNGVINVKKFGAKGDGSTNDYTALNKAFALAVSTGREVIIPEGTYVSNSRLYRYTYTEPVKVRGIGDVTIDFSNLAPTGQSYEYFSFKYDTSHIGTNNGAISKFDTTFVITSATGLSVGDYVLFEGTEDWSDQRADYNKGEYHQIKGISGTTIVIYDHFFDSYGDGTVTITKTCPGGSYFKNIKIKMAETVSGSAISKIGLTFDYFNGFDIENVEVIGADNTGMQIGYGKDIRITSYTSRFSPKSQFGYGISVRSCQDLVIDDANISFTRHAITIGATYPNRFIHVNNSYLANAHTYAYPSAIDCHGNAEYLFINGNTVIGGIGPRALNVTIENNKIFPRKDQVGVSFVPEMHPQQGYLIINNNEFHSLGATCSDAIQISMNTANDTLLYLEVFNNKIVGDADSLLYRQFIQFYSSQTTCLIKRAEIKNNYIPSSETKGIYGYGHLDFGDMIIDNNNLTSTEITIYFTNNDFDRLIISNNYLESTTEPAIYIINDVESGLTNIFDNNIVQASGGNMYPVGIFTERNNISESQALFLFQQDYLVDSVYVPSNSGNFIFFFSDTVARNGVNGDTLVIRFYATNQITAGREYATGRLRSIMIREDNESYYNISETNFFYSDASNGFDLTAADSIMVGPFQVVTPTYVDGGGATTRFDVEIVNNYSTPMWFNGILKDYYNINKIKMWTK